MLPIIIVTALQALADSEPGPLDAFRANYASIKVDAQYRYTFGPANSKVLNRLWDLKEPEFDESAGRDRWALAMWGMSKGEVDGTWSCDGSAEHYQYATPEWMFKKAREHNGGKLPNPLVSLYPQYEGISDGVTWFDYLVLPQNEGRPVRPTRLNNQDPQLPGSMRLGPFTWQRTPYPFPQLLEIEAVGAKLKRRRSQRAGHPVEVEIYEFDPPEPTHKLSRVEISYDPAVGYLPRFARKVFRFEKDEAQILEMYLRTARPCAAGGFVPIEWYDALYEVSGFARRYPNYDDDTVIEPSESFELGHFRVTDLKDRSTPVSLNVEHFKGVNTPGGLVPFRPGTGSLSISELKALVQSRPGKHPASSLPDLSGKSAKGAKGPTLDREELSELQQFGDQPVQSWPWYAGGVVVAALIVAIILWRRRSGRALPLILLCWYAPGCTQQAHPPIVRLSARLSPSHILLGRETDLPRLKLQVQNSGTQAIDLHRADGGCSCRKIDQSKFPTTLAPGKMLTLDVAIASNVRTSIKAFAITFDTNRGSIQIPVSLLALPAHEIDPSTVSASLQEGQEKNWQFQLVHRAVFRGDGPKPITTLEAPPEFVATKVGSRLETVAEAPELQFEDTTYQVTLRENQFGNKKAFFTLRGPSGDKLFEVPVNWRRLPFLATAPDRVILGTRPVRVFLRCPLEDVELTRVIGKPRGVKAVVSSVRELTVMLDDAAPDVIDGQIEVGTTASGRPPLKIPVVRYAPARHTAGR